MKLTDEQIAEAAKRTTDKISKILRTKKRNPIKQKYGFDISEYEFSDEAKDCGVEFRVPAWVYPDIEINVKDTNGGDNTGLLMKEHAIALAKHFKLTAEDLR